MSELKKLPLHEAIRLRWILRDIRARRFKSSPIDPADIERLTQMGFVTVENDLPVLTPAADDEIWYSGNDP